MSLRSLLELNFLGRESARETFHVRPVWNLLGKSGRTTTKHTLIYMFIIMIAIGGLYYGLNVKLAAIDTLYFLTVLLGTVGYGDLYPSAKRDRWFTSFYLLTAIGIMTGMFAAQRELVASGRRIQLLDRAKKLGREMRGIRETLRVSVVADVNAFINEDVEIGTDSVSGSESEGSVSAKEKRSSTFKDMFMALSTKKGVVRKVAKKLGRSNADRLLLHELESLNIEQYDDELMRIVAGFMYDVLMVFIFIFVGAAVMVGLEDWDYENAVYWATITVTTVGFGDMVPRSDGGKAFTIVYIIISVVYITTAIADMAQYPVVLQKKREEMSVVSQFGTNITPDSFEYLIDNDFYDLISAPGSNRSTRPSTFSRNSPFSQLSSFYSPSTSSATSFVQRAAAVSEPPPLPDGRRVSKAEFILSLLFAMDKVAEKDVIIAGTVFDTLDADRDGFLSQRDVDFSKNEILKTSEEEDEKQREESKNATPRISLANFIGGASESPKPRVSIVSHLAALSSPMLNRQTLSDEGPKTRITSSANPMQLGGEPRQFSRKNDTTEALASPPLSGLSPRFTGPGSVAAMQDDL